MSDPTPEQLEHGLTEFGRYLMSNSHRHRVYADRGNGHAVNALRRRGLIEPQFDERGAHNIVWSTWPCVGDHWSAPMTPIGIEVAALAEVSVRPGGGSEPRRRRR